MLFEFFAYLFDNFSDFVDICIIANANIQLGDDIIATEILNRSHITKWYRKYHAAWVAQLERAQRDVLHHALNAAGFNVITGPERVVNQEENA